jgi:hypothetical protein
MLSGGGASSSENFAEKVRNARVRRSAWAAREMESPARRSRSQASAAGTPAGVVSLA